MLQQIQLLTGNLSIFAAISFGLVLTVFYPFSTNGCAGICSFISNSYNSFSSFCTFVFLRILIQYFCCCCFMLCCMSAMSYQSIEPIEFQRTYRYGPVREKQLSRIYECISHQLQIQNKSKRNKRKKARR